MELQIHVFLTLTLVEVCFVKAGSVTSCISILPQKLLVTTVI